MSRAAVVLTCGRTICRPRKCRYVAAKCGWRRNSRYADGEAHWSNRLRAGLEHNLAMVIAKAILGLRLQGVAAHELVREAALFGARHREGWGSGLTVLAALANLMPNLPDEATYLALYKGIRNVAQDCEGQPARHARQPLDKPLPAQTIGRWLRHWTAVRHCRCRRAHVAHRDSRRVSARGTCRNHAGGSDRPRLCRRRPLPRLHQQGLRAPGAIGWQHASAILPTTTGLLTSARGAEESNAWRHPVDLIALCADAASEAAGRDRRRPRSARNMERNARLGRHAAWR